MGEFCMRFRHDRRGGISGYAVMSLAIMLSGLFASQVAGPYLHARLAGVGEALAGLGSGPALAWNRAAGGCGDCAVRVVASPVGYPGLGALPIGSTPAFVVAASPGG